MSRTELLKLAVLASSYANQMFAESDYEGAATFWKLAARCVQVAEEQE